MRPERPQPAFFRIFNASANKADVLVDGRAFGSGFAPGASSALTRFPPKRVDVTVQVVGGRTFTVAVPLSAGNGTTLFLLEDSGIAVEGDRYAPPEGGSLARAVALDPPNGWGIHIREGNEILPKGAGTRGSDAISISPYAETTVELVDGKGRVLDTATFSPEPDRSYTILARQVRGKPKIEVLTNNPPLSPRGRMGFSAGS